MRSVITASKAGRWFAIGLVFLFIFMLPGCSVKKNYKALSFFFDGVPKPGEPGKEEKEPGTAAAKPTAHKPETWVKMVSRHPAFAQRKCRECHSIKSLTFLKGKKAAFCFTCHRQEKFTGEFIHGPVAVGACLACHLPHESKYKRLLNLDVPGLCISCHVLWENRDLESHSKGKTCTECHDPHAGDNRFLLKQTQPHEM